MDNVVSIDDFKVINRELVGGIEVVEAATADMLAMALATVLLRHRQLRLVQENAKLLESGNATKNRIMDARRRYSVARKNAHELLTELIGMSVSDDTAASPTLHAKKPDPM